MKYLIVFLVLASGCNPDKEDVGQIMAYVPIYSSSSGSAGIGTESPRVTKHPGKIYAYGNYLFQVEQSEGIHIIDNTSSSQAHKVAFLKVPTCSEIAIKSGYLYTNNMKDLLVFALSDITAPVLVKRVSNAFPEFSDSHPPFTGVYFECPDPSKGAVVGWEEKQVLNPRCRR